MINYTVNRSINQTMKTKCQRRTSSRDGLAIQKSTKYGEKSKL